MNSFFNGTLRVTLLRVVLALCIVLSVLPPTDMVYGQADDGGSTIFMPIVQGNNEELAKPSNQDTSVETGSSEVTASNSSEISGNMTSVYMPLLISESPNANEFKNSSATYRSELAGYTIQIPSQYSYNESEKGNNQTKIHRLLIMTDGMESDSNREISITTYLGGWLKPEDVVGSFEHKKIVLNNEVNAYQVSFTSDPSNSLLSLELPKSAKSADDLNTGESCVRRQLEYIFEDAEHTYYITSSGCIDSETEDTYVSIVNSMQFVPSNFSTTGTGMVRSAQLTSVDYSLNFDSDNPTSQHQDSWIFTNAGFNNNNTALTSTVNGWLTGTPQNPLGFSATLGTFQHAGIDYAGNSSSQVQPLADGVFRRYVTMSYPGHVAIVEHKLPLSISPTALAAESPPVKFDPNGYYSVYSAYGHIATDDNDLVPGNRVDMNTEIADLHGQGGNTHLHLELRFNEDARTLPLWLQQNGQYYYYGRNVAMQMGPGYTFPNSNPEWWGYINPSVLDDTEINTDSLHAISGRVFGPDGNQPIPNANLRIDLAPEYNLYSETNADSNGYYTFEGIPRGVIAHLTATDDTDLPGYSGADLGIVGPLQDTIVVNIVLGVCSQNASSQLQAASIASVNNTCEPPTIPNPPTDPNPPNSPPASDSSDLVEIRGIGSGENYQFVPCAYEENVYIDRDIVFTEGKNDSNPNENSDYKNRWCLQTANDDKNDGSGDLIRLRLKKNAQIRILIDRRTTDTAAWMDGVFENAESEMDASGEMGSFTIYDCNSKPGEIVLGGPKYQGGDGSKSMYIVQIREGGNGDKLCTGNFGSTSSVDDASDLVELQSVGTGKDYQIIKCAFEEDVYIDRDIVFTEGKNDSNPNDNSDYKDRWCLQTANNDKDDDSDNLVVLDLKKNAQVRVLIDRRTTEVAGWMNGVFGTPVGVMDVSNDDMGHFDIYECYSKPGMLTFGGPKYQGGDGGRGTYIVQIREGGSGDKLCTGNFGSTSSADDASDLVELQSVGTGKDYQIVKCAFEEDVYIDRDIFFTEGKNDSNPNDNSDYKDRWCLQTANDDKDDDSNNLVVLNLKKNAQVRVLIDRRTTTLPAWMNGVFGAPVGVMDVSNDDMGHFDIYECYSKPGTLTFGGPKYQGGDGGRDTYIVQIREGGSGDKLCTGNVSVANNPPILDGELWELEGNSPHPWVNSTLEFVPLKTKHTTDSGNGWRHEYKIKKEHRVAMTDIYEELQATIRVDMSDGAKTIVAQHHASHTGTIMKLYVADSEESGFDDSVPANGIFDVYVRLRNADGNEEKQALGTIRSGDSFTFRVVNKYGVVRVEAFDRLFELEVEDDSASYLKFGNYLQSQDPYDISDDGDCGTPGDSGSFEQCYEDFDITEAKVTMANVSYTRSTEPGLDFPAPLFTPSPTPTPVTQQAGWTQVPGPASDISVGCDNNVWKLGMGGAIFRYTGGDGATNSWVQVPGNLRTISVACDGEVWGVNSQNKIYRYRPSDNGWTNIQGSLRNISVGCGQVWGVNTSSKVYSRPLNAGWSYQGWGNARELSTDCDGEVWGVQLSQYIHRWQGQAAGAYGYKNMKQIDAGCNDKAAGIDNDGRLYLWVNGGWLSTEHTGILRVSLGCDDNIWMIDSDNKVYRSTFNQLYQVVPATSPFSYIEASSNFVTSTTAKAVDGGTNGNWNQGNGSVFASNDANQPWWYGELDEYRYIDTVTIYNRTECCTDRMNNTVLFISDVPFKSTDFQETQSQYGVKAYPITGVQNTYTINVGALGRYVRLQHSGNEYLNFAEIQVNSRSLKQLSGFESVDASGVYAGATTAYRAADGNTNGDWHAEGSVFHSGDTKNPWWFGDLGASRQINEIVVHNRTDCCSARADGLYVFVSDNPFTSKNFQDTLAQPGVMSYQLQGTAAQYTVPVNRTGRYVRVQESGTDYMNIAEVVVR